MANPSAMQSPLPLSNTWKLTLPCTRAEAEALEADGEFLFGIEPTPSMVAQETIAFDDAHWECLVYFDGQPSDASIKSIHARLPSAKNCAPTLEQLPDEDWLTMSQQGLNPVHAGRFFVHTSHYDGPIPSQCKAFLIEASQAFGTGGHETTSGCLSMLDNLRRRGKRYNHIADIGTGTGLLAFAAGYLWPNAYLTASDIDPISVDITWDNAAENAVFVGQNAGQLATCVASGTQHEMIQRRAPYDLVIANILAGPLIELAPAFADITAEGGDLILAGLLNTQADAVLRAYRANGYKLNKRTDTGDWPCLMLTKRRRYSWKRPSRAAKATRQPPGDFGTW